MKLKKWNKNPVLTPLKGSYWEKLSVLNPGAWYEDGKIFLLYRASGEIKDYKIYIGLAESTDGYNFKRVSEKPVLPPSENGFDAGCVEDPRIVKIDGLFYITYAARAFPYYAFCSGKRRKEIPEQSKTWVENLTRSGIAVSKDLKIFKRLGPVTRDDIDDRDVILFPEKINGKYVMLHRPMECVGDFYNCKKPSIWMAFSDDLLHWQDEYLLAQPEFEWEAQKIGGSAPPVRTQEGWLTLYHGVDKDNVYRVGVMLLNLENPKIVIARAHDYIMEPETKFEKNGISDNVVFPCGNVIIGDELFVYYGGADSVCCLATTKVKDILDFVLQYKDIQL